MTIRGRKKYETDSGELQYNNNSDDFKDEKSSKTTKFWWLVWVLLPLLPLFLYHLFIFNHFKSDFKEDISFIRETKQDKYEHDKYEHDKYEHDKYELTLKELKKLTETGTKDTNALTQKVDEQKSLIEAEKAKINRLKQEIDDQKKLIVQYETSLKELKSLLDAKIVSLENQTSKVDYIVAEIDKLKPLVQQTEITWHVTDFEHRMQLSKQKEEVIYSPAFYTHTNGYKIRIVLYLNGRNDGLNNYISIYRQLVKGEFDDLLEWPFYNTVTFTLVDQNSDRSQVNNIEKSFNSSAHADEEKPVNCSTCEFGYSKFILHRFFYSKEYLKENKILIRVKVQKYKQTK